MKRLQEQTTNAYKLDGKYIATVVDIEDPKKRDRVKVRVHGIMSPDVPVEDCPWAEQQSVMLGDDFNQIGLSTCPKVGTLVYVSFLYGDPSFPIYEGIVRGGEDGSAYHTLKDVPARTLTGPEPESLHESAVYPFNNVIHTFAGVIYLDETEGNERIGIQHKTGSYIEIRPDGTVVYKSVMDEYDIVIRDKKVHIEGNVDELTKGNVNSKIEGNESEEIMGDLTSSIGGNVDKLTKGNVNSKIEGKKSEEIMGGLTSSIGGNADTLTKGNINSKIEGNESEEIMGDLTSSIGGKNQKTVSGSYVLTASSISLN